MEKGNSIYYEIENQYKNKSKMRYDSIFLWVAIVLFIPILSFFLVIKPHEYVEDIDNLPEPMQTETSWWTVFTVNWEKIFVDFLAEYDIQWRVLAKKDYWELFAENKIVNKIWPKDIVLWWWILWKEENMDLMRWSEYGYRYVQPFIKEYTDKYFDWFDEIFSGDYRHGNFWTLGLNFSNNHPVSDNRKIRKLLKHVKVWDVVRIKWYLVYIYPESWNWWWWPSSLVRDDHGCEIIYVTDITWLREK